MENQQDNHRPVLDYGRTPPVIPLYRRILSGILMAAGIIAGIAGLFTTSSPAARTNILTTAMTLLVWGLVIRYQHVRLWR